VTRGFQNFVRECSYEFDDAQKKKVRQFIESSFTEKVVSTIAKVSSDEEHKRFVPTLGDCVSNGSGAPPSEASNQAFPLHHLAPSCPLVRADAPIARNRTTSSTSTENPTKDTEGKLTDLAASGSPQSILSSAKVYHAGSAGQPGSGAAPQRAGLDNVSKQISSCATETSPERNQRDPGKAVLDENAVVFSGPRTEPGHTPSALAFASSREVDLDDHRTNQQVASGGNGESRAQIPVSPKAKHERNYLLKTTTAQLHSEQNHSVDRERRSNHGEEDIARPSPEETWSEEDRDQVLASWLSAKPTKNHCDQIEAFPARTDNLQRLPTKGYFAPQISRNVQTKAGIHSSSTSLLKAEFHESSPSTEYQIPSAGTSFFSSVSEDNLLSLPPPQEHPFHDCTSRSSLSRSSTGLSDFPSAKNTLTSPQPEETRGYYRMRRSEHSVRGRREDLSGRRNRPVRRQEGSSPQQRGSSQNQEGSPQGREQPPARREQTTTRREQALPRQGQLARHQQRPFHLQQGLSQPSTSISQPVIVGCALRNDDPFLTKTLAELAAHKPLLHRPYNTEERDKVHSRLKNNHLKHVDFSDEECEELLRIWLTIETLDEAETFSTLGSNCIPKLQECLQLLAPDGISDFVRQVRARSDSVLQGRRTKDITAFLSDLAEGVKPARPKLVRIEHQVIDPCHHPLRSTASLLRHREIGLEGRRHRNLRTELQLRTSEQILPWRSWKGASGDVVSCAWAPQSTTYAVGAAAPSNDEDLQYNRPRNLMLGDLISNTLEELPDHRIDRPKPETISSGPNSTQAVYDACDPMVYMTVSSLHFSCDGSRLYTASHDKTVKIWDVASKEKPCLQTVQHDDWVSDLDVSCFFRDVFAAATKTIDDSIHIYFPESDDDSISRLSSVHFHSTRAKERPQWQLYPECLRWGRTTNTCQLLLAGFQQWGETRDNRGREGQICLWNVHAGVSLRISPSSQSIFTATWHPTLDLFATGGSPSRSHNLTHPHSTRSVVRTWDVRSLSRFAVEYECPAIDMQDVTFNPLYPNIVTAGCTDSATYVWDFRKPDNYLHKLRHGRPLSDWDHTRPQEEGDPGVMMTVWGQESSRLYTGSSDGVVKCWDIMRAPEDVLIRDVGNLGAGIQSGAFSPDFSHLLVGDADGGVHILTSAPVDVWADGLEGSSEPVKFIQARDARQVVIHDDDTGTEGIQAAQELLDSGRLILDPVFGVGKGPNYTGPYATYARNEHANLSVSELLPAFEALQPFSNQGDENFQVSRKLKNLNEERRRIIAEKKAADTIGGEDGGVGKQRRETEDPTSTESTAATKRRFSEHDPISGPSVKKQKWQIVDLSTSPAMAPVFEPSSSVSAPHMPSTGLGDVEDNTIPESEMVEENHWWPRMDEEVFRNLGVHL
jgi:WD40 repeat protein